MMTTVLQDTIIFGLLCLNQSPYLGIVVTILTGKGIASNYPHAHLDYGHFKCRADFFKFGRQWLIMKFMAETIKFSFHKLIY